MSISYNITGSDFIALLHSKTKTIAKHVDEASSQQLDKAPLVCISAIRAINELKAVATALETQYASHVMNHVTQLNSKNKTKDAEKVLAALKSAKKETE